MSRVATAGVARKDVGLAVDAQLTPDMMVSLMLHFEQKWMLIKSFVTLVIVGLPNGRVAADGSSGRTDDGRVVCHFKLDI